METKVALGLIHGGPPQVIIFLDDSSVTVDNALLFPVR